MCIRVKRFPEFGVDLVVYSGALTRETLTRFIAELQPVDGARWINYLDPTLDESGLDVAYIPALKRAFAEKLTALHGETRVRSALVTASPVNELILRFWPSYVGRDVRYPAEPVACRTLDEACEALGLPAEARPALAEAVAADARAAR